MSITTATWSKKEEKDYYQDPNINNMISKQHQVLYRKSAENSFHQPKDFRFSPDSGVKYTKEKKKIFVVLCCCYSANLWWSAKTDIKYGVGAGKYWDIKLPFLHLLLLFYLPVCVLSSIWNKLEHCCYHHCPPLPRGEKLFKCPEWQMSCKWPDPARHTWGWGHWSVFIVMFNLCPGRSLPCPPPHDTIVPSGLELTDNNWLKWGNVTKLTVELDLLTSHLSTISSTRHRTYLLLFWRIQGEDANCKCKMPIKTFCFQCQFSYLRKIWTLKSP